MCVSVIDGLTLDLGLLIDEIAVRGYCVMEQAIATDLLDALYIEASDEVRFRPAAIGRGVDEQLNTKVRSDEIAWMKGESEAQQRWLAAMSALRLEINRHLFMGLFSFECHYAHYAPGHFYKKHFDAFEGSANRRLSVVAYLNPEWQEEWGGELVIYDKQDRFLKRVQPKGGSVVVFLSEDFPHEVLPTQQDRFSIAGWFRVNTTHGGKIDPPR